MKNISKLLAALAFTAGAMENPAADGSFVDFASAGTKCTLSAGRFVREEDERGQAAYVNDLLKAMFVAATRTKGDLYLTYARRNAKGFPQLPSRFLKGL